MKKYTIFLVLLLLAACHSKISNKTIHSENEQPSLIFAIQNDTTDQSILEKDSLETDMKTLTSSQNDFHRNLIQKSYWKDLGQQLLKWIITQVPAIIIWTLLFIVSLKTLRFLIKRLKKIAQYRILHNTNPDDTEESKRIETLFGIFTGIGNVFLWTIFILIILSKFNINIAPLLASAGIVGLAIGFGAQELVRDFIAGFFILLEDQIRTGDIAIINGTTGTVEKIAIRTTTLRDASGVVHIFQNGKINSLSNMTKGWSAIIVDIRVAYKEDTDQINQILKQVGNELMKDENWKNTLLGVDLWGIDNFSESAVILKVKLTTKSGQQWAASREFRRRVKKAFDLRNIENPIPKVNINTNTPPSSE